MEMISDTSSGWAGARSRGHRDRTEFPVGECPTDATRPIPWVDVIAQPQAERRRQCVDGRGDSRGGPGVRSADRDPRRRHRLRHMDRWHDSCHLCDHRGGRSRSSRPALHSGRRRKLWPAGCRPVDVSSLAFYTVVGAVVAVAMSLLAPTLRGSLSRPPALAAKRRSRSVPDDRTREPYGPGCSVSREHSTGTERYRSYSVSGSLGAVIFLAAVVVVTTSLSRPGRSGVGRGDPARPA